MKTIVALDSFRCIVGREDNRSFGVILVENKSYSSV